MPVNYEPLRLHRGQCARWFQGPWFQKAAHFLGPHTELSGETLIAWGSQFMNKNFGLLFRMWGWFFFQFLSCRTMEWHSSWCFLWRIMMRNYLLCLQVFKNSLVRVPERIPIQVSGCGEADCNGKRTGPWGWWTAGRQSIKNTVHMLW